MRPSGGSDRLCELGVDVVALIDRLGDRSQGVGVCDAQVLGLHRVGPSFERCCLFGAGPGHGVHQPFRNFDRAGKAWITAVPASSVTPSKGSPLVDGPINIVTAGSFVSKAIQWWRSAWDHVVVGDTVLADARLDVHA